MYYRSKSGRLLSPELSSYRLQVGVLSNAQLNGRNVHVTPKGQIMQGSNYLGVKSHLLCNEAMSGNKRYQLF